MFMKLLITTIFIFASFLAIAQVNTGGGSVSAGPVEQRLPRVDVFDKDLEGKFDELTAHLVARELICRKSPEQKLIINFDFMQTYNTLSSVKSLSVLSKQCQKTEINLKCLSDEKTASMIKEITEHYAIKAYMLKRFNLSVKEIEEVLNFLKTFSDSYCPKTKASCEM
jgi:hypothetical protein